MARDTQQDKVYTAEDAFLVAHPQRRLTIKECQRFVADVQSRPVWREFRAGAFQIQVRLNQNFKATIGQELRNGTLIEISDEGRNRLVLLHEMAHCLLSSRGQRGLASHGPEYMWFYRELVFENLKAFLRWEYWMLYHGVRWSKEAFLSRYEI